MNRILPIFLAALAGCSAPRDRGYDNGAEWSSCVPVESFHLLDSTGKAFGPFSLTNGAPVTVGPQTLSIQKVQRGVERIENYMKLTKLPEISFRDAMLSDVLSFLGAGSAFGPEDEGEKVEFVILGRDIARLKTTLALKDATVYNVFTVVCDMHGLTYKIDDRGVVFVMRQSEKQ